MHWCAAIHQKIHPRKDPQDPHVISKPAHVTLIVTEQFNTNFIFLASMIAMRATLPKLGPVSRQLNLKIICASSGNRTFKMSPKRQRRPENVPGPIFVDHTCIDCDTCRWMAPETFTAINGASATSHQPEHGSAERHAALQALMSCPTFSIHVEDASPGELAAARDSFPLAIPGTKNVYHLGHHSERTYGAAPFLITRPGLGNIMIDVPRWSPQLAQRIQAVGGVKYIFLSHRDDVAGHDRWAAHLGAKRIIHELEANSRQGTE
jgi:ferredoxin